jgi:outer membrane protein insertion porin family
MAYVAVTPQVQIGGFDFTGASSSIAGELNKAAASFVGTEYRRSALQGFEDVQFKPVYLNRGYLKAGFGEPSTSITGNGAETTKIAIKIAVMEGKQYKLSALNWSGSEIIPSATAAKLYPLKPGEIANQDLLKKSLSVIASAYFSKGYLKANVKAAPNFDDAAQMVAYDIAVVPGDLYHLRKVEFQNLNDVQLKQVQDAWKLHQGDVYDPTYVQTFLPKNRASLHALDGWSAVWTQKIYDDDKVVDLILMFRKGGPLQRAGE